MSEKNQLLITLVHGTWPHGFFPRYARFKQWVRNLIRRERQELAPYWYENNSSFLARLGTELGDIPYKLTPLLWSGENSIRARDETTYVLAEHLSAEHAEHPQATQLVIAHSHGGNIALRALHHLNTRNASTSSAGSANPLVVTLATPFVEDPANFGHRPTIVRLVFVCAILWGQLLLMLRPPKFLEALYEKHDVAEFAIAMVLMLSSIFILWWAWWWIRRRTTARQSRVQSLNAVTQLGHSPSTNRLLVVRAIDDEASLLLAFGTTLNYLTTIGIVAAATLFGLFLLFTSWIAQALFDAALPLLAAGWTALSLFLFGLLVVSRSAHGWELATSPMECQINTQSTPDAAGISRIVTLVQHTYIKTLRHGIYEHDECAKAIADWVRSEFSALPMRRSFERGEAGLGDARMEV